MVKNPGTSLISLFEDDLSPQYGLMKHLLVSGTVRLFEVMSTLSGLETERASVIELLFMLPRFRVILLPILEVA